MNEAEQAATVFEMCQLLSIAMILSSVVMIVTSQAGVSRYVHTWSIAAGVLFNGKLIGIIATSQVVAPLLVYDDTLRHLGCWHALMFLVGLFIWRKAEAA